ncbi:MAG: NAD(P)/FAD-dependent oxidoreductase [Phreatobacter sp.]|uniref:NAD(P)/FAD-dependent oxidoreductase n=1 Tax=Phreatobacter sp. TaxID=1966341 RepID=UPI00403623DC
MALAAPQLFDCVIIGGGPAGLTAALYLARFRRSALVLDRGASRAKLIPLIRNMPGFPDGISGQALLERLTRQLLPYGRQPLSADVLAVQRHAQGFLVTSTHPPVIGRTVIFATGVVDVRPSIAGHDDAVRDGLIRYCPVCDGYEVAGKHVGLLVPPESAASKAQYLRRFTDRLDVQLIEPRASVEVERRGAGIARVGCGRTWDTLYAAMGSEPQSALASALAVALNKSGCILTGDHQQTSAAGVYAVGDVAAGLDQITVAMGQAALAASHINLRLQP